jgi:hypothetical protein
VPVESRMATIGSGSSAGAQYIRSRSALAAYALEREGGDQQVGQSGPDDRYDLGTRSAPRLRCPPISPWRAMCGRSARNRPRRADESEGETTARLGQRVAADGAPAPAAAWRHTSQVANRQSAVAAAKWSV